MVKSRTLDGYDAPYVPGWDRHGLADRAPDREDARQRSEVTGPREFRKACREYALSQVEAQRVDFQRLA